MAQNETFEDRFDHDPHSARPDDTEIDLDDDFDESEVDFSSAPQYKTRNLEPPGGGCLGGLFKIALSLGMIGFCVLYISRPDLFDAVQNKIAKAMSMQRGAPVLNIGKNVSDAPAVDAAAPAASEEKSSPYVVLRGAGILPDFSTAAKRNPSLNGYLTSAEKTTFQTLGGFRPMVESMIADWAGEKDRKKIEELIGVSYRSFYNYTAASLLSQTVLKQAGLTPVRSPKMVEQDAVKAMAVVYTPLREAISAKTTVREQLKIIEPVSTFLLYLCGGDSECLVSWDLLIDMLGMKKYAAVLEKSPENIYK